MLFNFMTPIIRKIEIDSQQRRILSKRYCRKGKLDSLTLQNIFLRLEKSDLLVKPSKEKHISNYGVVFSFLKCNSGKRI